MAPDHAPGLFHFMHFFVVNILELQTYCRSAGSKTLGVRHLLNCRLLSLAHVQILSHDREMYRLHLQTEIWSKSKPPDVVLQTGLNSSCCCCLAEIVYFPYHGNINGCRSQFYTMCELQMRLRIGWRHRRNIQYIELWTNSKCGCGLHSYIGAPVYTSWETCNSV